MAYVEKTCPICGKEFMVLKKAEEKAVYCTLACLTEAQKKLESRGMAFSGLS
jgi:predicted nucleic acid-binding Zn ribbon protein